MTSKPSIPKTRYVPSLAAKVGMAPRTFARRFRDAVGRTPGTAVEFLRVDAAKRMLEVGEPSLKRIAARSGFRNEQAFRRAFRRLLGISPVAYRARFA